jgi:GT2 family glycosyltransferase
MESDQNVAACQPKVLSFKDKTKFEYAGAAGGFMDLLAYPFCRGRMFDQCETDDGHYENAMPIFWATGACLMVRMSAYRKLNGLEEHFFAHMEEIDLCWRWLHQGFSIWVEPSSVVYHLGGGTLKESSPRKTFLNFRNGFWPKARWPVVLQW